MSVLYFPLSSERTSANPTVSPCPLSDFSLFYCFFFFLLPARSKVGRKCRPLHFNAPDECCPYSETFLTLSLSDNRHIHIESVFAHPFLKMWKFSEQKDRRTALILGILYCERAHSALRCLTYIPSVGHWSVYFCSGLTTTFT